MKILTTVDHAQNQIINARIHNNAGAPPSPVAGQVYFDTTLHQFGVYNDFTTSWVYLGSGGGTVTSASVVSANGFAGSVATSTTTPAITITTSITGILKGNGTAISAATSGTDYAPATSGTSSLKGNGSGGFSAATLNDNGAATADYSINSHKLTNLLDPASAQDAATKNYVDNIAQGLSPKPSVRVATTGVETFTIASGSVTQISGTTVDGISPSVGDRILVKDAPASTGAGSANSTQPGNGLYSVTSNTTNLSLSRATDMDDANDPPAGAYVYVEAGTANSTAAYAVISPSSGAAFTYGTTNIAWGQFNGAADVIAGTGLSKSGNTISLSNPVTVALGGTGAATLTGLVKGNGTSAMTAAVASTDYVKPFAATIGDGSTTAIAVTHSLGTQNVISQVRDATTNVVVECDMTQTSTSVTTFTFAVAPALNAYKVVIIG